MKRTRTITTLCVALLALAAQAFAQVKDYRDIKSPPLRSFSVPQPKRIELPNGMIIFLQEDHELPLIRGTARIRGGGRDVPAEKTGLAGVLAAAWRTGGTTTRTGDELDDFLEARAAKVETGGSLDSTTVNLDVLKGDFDTVFPIFLDVLRNPAFRQDKIELAKTQANTGISRRNDEMDAILQRESTKLGYGPESPYARHTEYATIAAITRDDLVAFHKRYVHPNNIILGLVGDFDSTAMEAKLRQTFASWSRGPEAAKPPTIARVEHSGIHFIPKEDVTQAGIAVVHGGAMRNTPDYAALQVMNEILSGGFSGRLMNRLRTQMGVTYGVGGGVGTDWDHPGLFRVYTTTKSGSTVEAINAIRTELTGLHTQAFTPDELTLAKESILNAYVFTVDSKAKVLQQRMQLEFYGYPADFFQRYPGEVAKVTAADVSRVAKQYVTPDRTALLVVGKASEFDKPLTTLGQVRTIDITIPEPGQPARPTGTSGGAASAAPATGNAEGKALARKVLDFVGGKAKIDAIRTMRNVVSARRKTPQGMMDMEMDAVTSYPDSHRMTMKMPMGEMTMVVTPEAGFAVLPGAGVQDLPGSQRDAVRAESKHDLITILKNIDNPKYTFTLTGREKVGDVDASVVEINADGPVVRWFVDPASGRLLRKSSRSRMPGETGDQLTDFTAWKEFGGVRMPTTFVMTSGGQDAGGMEVKSIEINPTLAANTFQKP